MKFSKKINRGTTRTTLLIGNYAIKLPSFSSYRLFLYGLLHNMNEKRFSNAEGCFDSFGITLCPVIFSLPGGFLNVMPRADICEEIPHIARSQDLPDMIESKADSFGYVDGKLVVVDYG